MVEFDLLQKTELRFEQIHLQGANLNDVAAAVADVLGLERHEVLVIDAINNTLAIDLLRKTIDAYSLIGKKDVLFERLSQLPNVVITEKTTIHSEGVLGWIAMDEAQAKNALRISENMYKEIRNKLAKRAIVFSTGFEVISGQIEDTNQPTIAEALKEEGYTVARGPALKDDLDYIAGMIRVAIEQDGYGVVITTGGVGAETKDHSVEALNLLDPDAATPYIAKFEQGRGRHAKDGIRVGVGEHDGALIVVLPGPNDEVRASLPFVIEGLKQRMDKHSMAEKLARNLRDILREKMHHHHAHPIVQ